jgi:hypothetical protein
MSDLLLLVERFDGETEHPMASEDAGREAWLLALTDAGVCAATLTRTVGPHADRTLCEWNRSAGTWTDWSAAHRTEVMVLCQDLNRQDNGIVSGVSPVDERRGWHVVFMGSAVKPDGLHRMVGPLSTREQVRAVWRRFQAARAGLH